MEESRGLLKASLLCFSSVHALATARHQKQLVELEDKVELGTVAHTCNPSY
jgi:hypothetical protein